MESIINTITTKLEQDFRKEYEKTISSLEVAEMIGKRHDNLLSDIREYVKEFSLLNFKERDYFYESTYRNRGRDYPCYEITKKGCEFIAHKLTGIKGTEFTVKYIDRFHDMEDSIKGTVENKPSLDSVNTAANILERAYRLAGTDNRYLALLVGSVYKQFGMEFSLPSIEMDTDKLYDQTMIANELGIMSTSGKPHAQATGAIIEILDISKDDMIRTPYTNRGHSGVMIQYKPKIVDMVRKWLEEKEYPQTIVGKNKKYSVLYR